MSALYYRSVSAIYSEAHANLVARRVRGRVIAVHENRAHGVPTEPRARFADPAKAPSCLPFADIGE